MTLTEIAARCGMTPDEFRAHVSANVDTAPSLSASDASAIRGLLSLPITHMEVAA